MLQLSNREILSLLRLKKGFSDMSRTRPNLIEGNPILQLFNSLSVSVTPENHVFFIIKSLIFSFKIF
jgi:hypothetical protein